MNGRAVESDLLRRVREAMENGGRLDVVRLFFNERHPWGVHVYRHGTTPSGRDKWTKVTLIVPGDDQTLGDVLKMLGDMTEQPTTDGGRS